jgi:hypothetical protein
LERSAARKVTPQTLENSRITQTKLELPARRDFFRSLLKTRSDTETLLEKMKTWFARDRHKERALSYLLEWGYQFWEDTEYRIKEVTSRVEKGLQASIAGKVATPGPCGSVILDGEDSS